MDVTVWVEDWQMQCCGTPFVVGSEVSWTVVEPLEDGELLSTILGEGDAAAITYVEDHHEPEQPIGTLRGTVRAIRAVHCGLAETPAGSGSFAPVPGSGIAVHVSRADGWETARKEKEFRGYLVDLHGSSVQPAPRDATGDGR